ncbi:hypothetical protein AURDEDRAFT_115312 [Auricularia subglabra TFB-10046 SS5]|nr:hypothetical protein AURDEDRAFT_115312 [Auricularia subglabra TFB-10046 SS5]
MGSLCGIFAVTGPLLGTVQLSLPDIPRLTLGIFDPRSFGLRPPLKPCVTPSVGVVPPSAVEPEALASVLRLQSGRQRRSDIQAQSCDVPSCVACWNLSIRDSR